MDSNDSSKRHKIAVTEKQGVDGEEHGKPIVQNDTNSVASSTSTSDADVDDAASSASSSSNTSSFAMSDDQGCNVLRHLAFCMKRQYEDTMTASKKPTTGFPLPTFEQIHGPTWHRLGMTSNDFHAIKSQGVHTEEEKAIWTKINHKHAVDKLIDYKAYDFNSCFASAKGKGGCLVRKPFTINEYLDDIIKETGINPCDVEKHALELIENGEEPVTKKRTKIGARR